MNYIEKYGACLYVTKTCLYMAGRCARCVGAAAVDGRMDAQATVGMLLQVYLLLRK
jgi:hypothetical protein